MTGTLRRWARPVTIVGAIVLLLVAGGVFVKKFTVAAAPAIPEPFTLSSPWRIPVPAAPVVDPDSAAMIAGVQSPPGLVANLLEFGIPIYTAAPDTPRYTVTCTEKSWGPCPFDGITVPIPDGARPHTGTDGAMVVVDESQGRSYEFWQAHHDDETWSTTFGAINPLGGSGWGGASTGSGASRLGGVVRMSEVAAGDIGHALALQTNNACASVFRAPATKTDGGSTRPDCLPEGARLQLDPAVDLDSLDLTPAERMVAVAMQRYGGYVVDVSGTALSFSLELDPAAGGEDIGRVYTNAGFRWDYDNLAGVPWERLRVIE